MPESGLPGGELKKRLQSLLSRVNFEVTRGDIVRVVVMEVDGLSKKERKALMRLLSRVSDCETCEDAFYSKKGERYCSRLCGRRKAKGGRASYG